MTLSTQRYVRGVRAGLPVTGPLLLIAISFGVLARGLGWGVAAPTIMSIVVFSGSAQFAVAGVLGAGGSAGAAIATAALVNARFLPMSVSVTPFLRGNRLRRAIEAQSVVDAGWALSRGDDGTFDREFLIGFFLAMVPAWVGGTLVGTLVGSSIGRLETFGLDAVFPAFFLALLADELHDPDSRRVAVLAAAITLVLLPFAPAGIPVVAATAAVFATRSTP